MAAHDDGAARQRAPFEEVALRDAGDDCLEQGVEAVGRRERGVALAEAISLEEERAEAHEHSVDDRVGAEVAAALVAAQAERVERGVAQALGGEPGARGRHVAQAHRDVRVAVGPPGVAPGGDPGHEPSLEVGPTGEAGGGQHPQGGRARLLEGGSPAGALVTPAERQHHHGLAVVARDLLKAKSLVETRGGVGALDRERQRGVAELRAPLDEGGEHSGPDAAAATARQDGDGELRHAVPREAVAAHEARPGGPHDLAALLGADGDVAGSAEALDVGAQRRVRGHGARRARLARLGVDRLVQELVQQPVLAGQHLPDFRHSCPSIR